MKQNGVVIKTDDNGTAQVSVKRESACEACRIKNSCITCKKTISSVADNSIGAKEGDTVTLETPSSLILLYSALVFILPIIVALASYFIGTAVFKNDISPYILSLVCFILTFIVLNITINKRASKKNSVKIIGIVESHIVSDNNDTTTDAKDNSSEDSDQITLEETVDESNKQ